MIGVLRPKLPSSSGGKEHARLPTGGPPVGAGNAVGQRYLADKLCPTTSGNIAYGDYTNQPPHKNETAIPDRLSGPNDEHSCFPSSSGGIAIPVLSSATNGDQLADLGAEVGKLCVAVVRQSFPQASRSILSTEEPPSTASSTSNVSTRLLRCLRLSWNRYDCDASLVLYLRLPGAIAAFPLGSPVFRLQEDFSHENTRIREASYIKRSMCWTLPLRGFEALLNMEQSIAPGLSTLTRDMAADKHFVRDVKVVRGRACNNEGRAFLVVPRMLGIAIVNLPVHHMPRGTISMNAAAAATAEGTKAAAVVARLEKEGKSGRCRLILEPRDVRFVDESMFFPLCHNSLGLRNYAAKKRVSFPTTYAELLGETRPRTPPSPMFRLSRLAKWLRLRCRQSQPSSNRIVPGVVDNHQPEVVKQSLLRETAEDDSQVRKQYSCSEESRGCSGWNQPVEVGVEPRHLTADSVRSSSLTTITSWALTPHFVRELMLAAAYQGEREATADSEMHGVDRPLAVRSYCVEARGAACAILARVLGEVPEKKRKPDDATECARPSSVVMDQWYEAFWDALALPEGDTELFHRSARLLLEGLLAIPGVKAGFLQRGLLWRLSNSLRSSLSKSWGSERASDLYDGHEGSRDLVGCSRNASHLGAAEFLDPGVDQGGTCREKPGLRSGKAVPFSAHFLSTQRNPKDIPWWLLRCDLVSNINRSGSAVLEGDGATHNSTDFGEDCEIALRERLVSQGDESVPPTSRDTSHVDHRGQDNDRINMEESGAMLVSPSSDGPEVLEQRGRGKNDTGDGEGIVTRDRVAPPMLRLDMLDRSLGKKDGVSPRRSSRVSAIALSAASTRVLARLPTFRSVRDTTSRASARHGSGRSARTGPTTQRDLISPGWLTGRSSCSPALADQDPPRPGSPSPLQARARDSPDETLTVYDCGHTSGVKREASEFRDNSTSNAEDLRNSDSDVDASRPVPEKAFPWALPIANISTGSDSAHGILKVTAQNVGTDPVQQMNNWGDGLRESVEYAVSASTGVHQSRKTISYSASTAGSSHESGACCTWGLCSNNLPADLVLRIACASAPPVDPLPGPQQHQQTSRRNHDIWTDMVAAAKLLISLLSSSTATDREVEIEEALGVALNILSTGDVRSQYDAVLSRTKSTTIERLAFQGGAADILGPETQGWKALVSFPLEFDFVDPIPLLEAIAATFHFRNSRLRSHFKSGREGAYGEVASVCHRQWVQKACSLSLESAWLTGLLLKRVASLVDNPDEQRLSSPPVGAVEYALSFCGRALRESLFSCSFSTSSGDDASGAQDSFMADLIGEYCESAGAFLLLSAPVIINLASTFTVLLRRSRVWGEDLVWSEQTLHSIALGGDRSAVPVIVELLEALVISNEEEYFSAGSPLRLPIRTCSGYDSTRELMKNLAGDTHAVDELLTSIVQSLSAVLQRSNTLLETYRGLPSSNRVSTPMEALRREDNSTGMPMSTGENSHFVQAEQRSEGTSVHVTTEKRGNETAGYDPTILKTYGEDFEDSFRRIKKEIAPAFRLRGSVRALLLAMPLVRHPEGGKNGGMDEPPSMDSSRGDLPEVICSAALLTATLRLSALFFAIQEKQISKEEVTTDDGEDRGTLEVFAASIFSAFCRRYKEILAKLKVNHGLSLRFQEQNLGASNKTVQRKINDDDILLCRLHLEVLAKLAASCDISVRKRMWEMRAAQFLLRHFFEPAAERSLGCAENFIRSFGDAEGLENSAHVARGIKGGTDGTTATRGGVLCSTEAEIEEGDIDDAAVGNEDVGISVTQFAPLHRLPITNTSTVSEDPHHGKLSNGLRINLSDRQEINFPSEITKKGEEAFFVAGDRVDGLVAFRQKRPRWFPGRVERTNADGSLHICYDDGDEELEKARREVRPHRKRSKRIWRQSSFLNHPGGLAARVMDVGSSNNAQVSAVSAVALGARDCAGKVQHEASTVEESTACRTSIAFVTCDAGDAATYTGATSSIVAEATDCSEDDDVYFVIPSVLKDKLVAPVSAIPRINLKSPKLRSRVRSSQLGPGSSLSTPTTGGSGGETLLRRGGSRSEASLATSFPNGSTVNDLRTPMDQSPSIFTSRDSFMTSSAPTLASVRAEMLPPGNFGLSFSLGGSDLITGRLSRGVETHTEKEYDEEKGRVDAALVERREGDGGDTSRRTDKSEVNIDEALAIQEVDRMWSSHRSRDELRRIRVGAVTILLALASSPEYYDIRLVERGQSTPSSPPSGLRGDGDFLADTMKRLQLCFEDPRNTDLVASLTTRWSGKSTWEAASAVLAKLVCAALFDAQSYSLDGQHIASGSFGGIIVSRSPLPLKSLQPTPCYNGGLDAGASVPRNNYSPSLSTSSDPMGQKRLHGDEVALKMIDRDDFEGQAGPSVFFEVLALRTLSDVPGVCQLYDFGVTPTAYVMVLERCLLSVKGWRAARGRIAHGKGDCAKGESDLSTSLGPRSEQETALYLLMFRQVVAAVTTISERGIIHLDLKCDNVLVRDEIWDASSVAPRGLALRGDLAEVPCVCVTDFGEAVIGRRRESSPSEVDVVSKSSDPFEFNVRSARGTERIQSPEMIVLVDCGGSGGGGAGGDLHVSRDADQDRPQQFGGRTRKNLVGHRAAISTASDVWSLGCLLYELLSGQLLFGDMPWSEFFVTLTAGEDVVDNAFAQEKTVNAMPPTPSVLPLAALCPFSRLSSAGILRALLESILVRDSIKRPKAYRVIQNVDKALDGIAALIPTYSANGGGGETASTLSMARSTEGFVDCGTLSESALKSTSKRGSLSETQDTTELHKNGALCGTSYQTSMWPLRPCAAVIAQQRLVEYLSIAFDYAGCLYRLGAGGFLLNLKASTTLYGATGTMAASGCNEVTSGDEVRCNLSRVPPNKGTGLSPNTPVVCLPGYVEWIDVGGGCRNCAGKLPCPLGKVLHVLGVTHVVCVTSTKGNQDQLDKRGRSAYCGSSYLSSSSVLGGCRLLNIQMPADDKGCRSSLSGGSPAVCVGDVLAFATGPRVLFTGAEGDQQGAAGAMAMAWAMNRTGKGIFETLLDFRQSCAGFWVEPCMLRSVLGFDL